MFVAFVIVTVFAALNVGFSAYSVFAKASYVVGPLAEYGVPRSWWVWLGLAKAAGAVGLLVGLAVPAIGYAAAVGLVLYFLGAVITVLRARVYKNVVFPMIYMTPVAASLVLALVG